jgi:geranylgeranyl diphosphate synthase type I
MLLDEYSTLVNERLERYFESFERESTSYHPFIGECAGHLREYVLRGGARIMSASALLTYQGYTGKIDERILDLALGIELYRHSILIHDDMVDQDNERRGGPAFHRLFDYDDRFGTSLALFYGDLVYGSALKAFRFLDPRLIDLFRDGFIEVNESQILDLLFEYQNPSAEEWEVMASKRAASLFRATMSGGAILAGAASDEVEIMGRAGEMIGFAFDINDDIIGTFAPEEDYARPPGHDLVMGKKPLHVILALEMTNPKEISIFYEIAEKGLTPARLETIQDIIRNCGALEMAKERSREYAALAIDLIGTSSMNPDAIDAFQEYLEYVTETLNWYK